MSKRWGIALTVLTALIILSSNQGAWGQGAQPVTPQPPQPDGSIVHVVQIGDTLIGIALAYQVTLDQIRQLNHLGAKSMIVQGQKLLIKPAANQTVAVATNLVTNAPPTPTQAGNQAPTNTPTTPIPLTPSVTPTATSIPFTPTPPPAATLPSIHTQTSICVTAFEDVNADRFPDASEPLVAGVVLALSQTSGAEATQTTNADTPTCFSDLAAGTFTLEALPPADYGLTTPGKLDVEVQSGAPISLTIGVKKGYVPPPPTLVASASTDTTTKTPLLDTLFNNSGYVVLGLAGLVLIGGLAVFALARRN